MPRTRLLCAAALATCLTLASAAPGHAATPPKRYASCAAVHEDYPAGIAKAGVTYNRVGSEHKALKGKVKFSTALYNANTKSDRDRDGIACELS